MLADGPDAAFALDPLSQPTPRAAVVAGMEQLQKELHALSDILGSGGGSNNWAIAGKRSKTGRPIIANDPHLFPFLPSQWYLAHVKTPEWETAGATLVGAPAIAVGHNGFAAWCATAGLVDNTDFFIEEIGPDGHSVREANGYQPCTIRRETIRVKGGNAVVEEVLETPRGPIVSPALLCEGPALSLRAVWLDPLPVRGLLDAHRCRSFEQFRDCFRHWPCLSLNMVYADVSGRIAWQLVGQTPIRRNGSGLTPQPAWLPNSGWEVKHVPFEQMPHIVDPDCGYVATANNHPDPDGHGPYLGNDFLDDYRRDAIVEHLAARTDWSVSGVQQLQMNTLSLPWRQMRDAVLRCTPVDKAGIVAWELLRDWDGHVRADSSGAAVFELFAAEMAQRIASAKTPKGSAWELGRRACVPGNNLFYCRRFHHLVSLLREQPIGWFESWPKEISAALSSAGARLTKTVGVEPATWIWGQLRRLTLRHPLVQTVPILRSVFNEGRVPIGGDGDTIMQAAVDLVDPIADTDNIPGMRLVIDVGEWSNSRFVIAGGQSGNPLSPHFLDMFPLWQRGDGVPIAWTAEEVAAATKQTLQLC
jgi:penicillin amidase